MKGYFKGYNDGITDTKRLIAETIRKHAGDNPDATLAAITQFCTEKEKE